MNERPTRLLAGRCFAFLSKMRYEHPRLLPQLRHL